MVGVGGDVVATSVVGVGLSVVVGATVVVVGGSVARVVGATAGRSGLVVGAEVGLVIEGTLVVVTAPSPPGRVEVPGTVVLGRLTEGRPDPEPPQETRIIPKRSAAPTAMPILLPRANAASIRATSVVS